MSLPLLLNFITEVFSAKIGHNQKALQAGKQPESMEEYMFTFLNQQYGVRGLIIKTLETILSSVKYHATMDWQVLAFASILQNKVTEEFWQSQMDLKAELSHKLIVELKRRYKSQAKAHQVYLQIIHDQKLIEKEITTKLLHQTEVHDELLLKE